LQDTFNEALQGVGMTEEQNNPPMAGTEKLVRMLAHVDALIASIKSLRDKGTISERKAQLALHRFFSRLRYNASLRRGYSRDPSRILQPIFRSRPALREEVGDDLQHSRLIDIQARLRKVADPSFAHNF
jgi:hypothetical protein